MNLFQCGTMERMMNKKDRIMGTCQGCSYLYVEKPSDDMVKKYYEKIKGIKEYGDVTEIILRAISKYIPIEKWECHKEVEPIELMTGRKACKHYNVEEIKTSIILSIPTPDEIFTAIRNGQDIVCDGTKTVVSGVYENNIGEGKKISITFDDGSVIEHTKET